VASSGVSDRLPAMCGSDTVDRWYPALHESGQHHVAADNPWIDDGGWDGLPEPRAAEHILRRSSICRRWQTDLHAPGYLTVQGCYLVIVGGQPVMRLNHFHAVATGGGAGLQAVASLFHSWRARSSTHTGGRPTRCAAWPGERRSLHVQHDCGCEHPVPVLKLEEGDPRGCATACMRPR